MDNALGNAFVVKVKYFFTQYKIFEKARAALTSAKAVLIIAYSMTEIISSPPLPIDVSNFGFFAMMAPL
jgi:hypothetical protein